MNRKYTRATLFGLGGCMVFLMAMPEPAYAATSFSMREKTLASAGIIDSQTTGKDGTILTRQEFAKMLVRASSYNSSVSAYNDVSVFPDVDRNSSYASYIRTAAGQGWMTAYLGGNFRPEEGIRCHEALKACLSLLGYSNEDFSGNQTANRLAKAEAIGLCEDFPVGNLNEVLSYQDCVNLFYNLLKTNIKSFENSVKSSNTIYGQLLGFSLSSDKELNMLETLEAKLKGPYVLSSGKKLGSLIPFSESSAVCYLNGVKASADELEEEAENDTVAIYYNSSTKTVYAYSSAGNGSGTLGSAEGTLEEILYNSSDIMVPSSIVIDGTEYEIAGTDMQYAFSVYGSVDAGEEITIVWQTDSEGNREVIAYIQ